MLKLAGTFRVSLLIAVVVTLASCTPQFRNHGYVPTDVELAQVIVGKDTKDSVATLIGRPSAAGVVGAGSWYYVESRFKHHSYREPEEIERQALAITFDSNDRLANIERFGMEDGQVITLSRRVTASSVRDTTFLRQLMGNIGNISADQFIQ